MSPVSIVQHPATDLRSVLQRLSEGKTLSAAETATGFRAIVAVGTSDIEATGFLAGLSCRGETADEVVGVVNVLRERLSKQFAAPDAVDLCGTGGDRSGMFNVSTAAAIVAAAAGAKVAKHGGGASTSFSGSADVMSALGVDTDTSARRAYRILQDVGLVFLSARHHHPLLARLAPIRKALGIRTIVNLAAPLANPFGVRRQIIGVAREAHLPIVATALLTLGTDHTLVVHGECEAAGVDEITTTGNTHVIEIRNGIKSPFSLEPERFQFRRVRRRELAVSSPEESAEIIRRVLDGDRETPAREIVLLNAGAAIYVAGVASSINEGVERAAEGIDSGRARDILGKLTIASRIRRT